MPGHSTRHCQIHRNRIQPVSGDSRLGWPLLEGKVTELIKEVQIPSGILQ